LINFKNDERDSKIFAKLGESTLKLLTENPIRFEGLENVLLELNRKSQDREIADFSEIEKVSSTLKRLSALVEKTQKAIQFENTDLQVEQFSLIDCLKDVQFSVLEKLIESKTFLLISKNVDTQLKADRVLMTQVLENLILNSIKSMTDLEEKWISVDVANKKGMVQIILSDSSLSVEKKVRSHIFDIDFSTKFNEHMGLTLMFVRNIMSVHGGSFVLDEKSSHNSFVISLPEIS
jgi:C4-dicarboxylate-specific signal transduction histidine kinase